MTLLDCLHDCTQKTETVEILVVCLLFTAFILVTMLSVL